MTQPEIMLWSRLKERASDKPLFRRQFAYGTMVFDFYCPAARLAVEIDGSTRWDEAKQAQDQARDVWLARRGIAVLRIGAHAVYSNLSRVADGIILRAAELIESPSLPAKPEGGATDRAQPRARGGGPPR